MVPRVVSVPMDLGASGGRLWVPEAGNTAQEQPHCGMAGEPRNVCTSSHLSSGRPKGHSQHLLIGMASRVGGRIVSEGV